MITTNQLSVGTARSAIDGSSNSNFQITIQNIDNSDTLYIGGPDVTTTNGLPLLKLEKLQVNMMPGETLYVISTKNGHSIGFMKQV
jgi:hypothetical protein